MTMRCTVCYEKKNKVLILVVVASLSKDIIISGYGCFSPCCYNCQSINIVEKRLVFILMDLLVRDKLSISNQLTKISF